MTQIGGFKSNLERNRMYFVLLAIFMLLMTRFDQNSKKIQFITKVILVFVLLLMIFRFPIGVDIDKYRYMYNYVPERYMYRYYLFGNIFKITSLSKLDFSVFILMYNIFCVFVIGICIHKYSQSILLSLFIFIASGICLVYYNSALRQMIAMVFYFWAYYEFLEKKKYLPYFVISLIGAQFHEVAYVSIAIGVYRILYDHFSIFREKFIYCILGGFSILMLAFGSQFLAEYAYLFGTFSVYLSNTSFSLVGLAMRLLLCAVVIVIYLSVKEEHKEKYKFSVLVYLISTFVYLAFSSYSLVSRVCDYVAIIELILIPNMIMEGNSNFINKCIILLYIAMNFIMMIDDMRYHTTVQVGEFDLMKYPYVSIMETYESADDYLVYTHLMQSLEDEY